MDERADNQVESERISTALEVEQIDSHLYRSKSLWIPSRSRGVFGGQVISQALLSATKCVDPVYHLHSLHCYFLLSASPAIPIIYHVDRIRDGRSYVTRAVRAVQHGRTVFMMMCSFQKPETWQPTFQWPMPPNVRKPDECDLIEAPLAKLLEDPKIDEANRTRMAEYVAERRSSPYIIKHAGTETSSSGIKTIFHWFKLKDLPKYDTSFQKCILAYISDSHFIGTASRTLGVDRMKQGAKKIGMVSTLDHAIWFYDNDFDCGDWLLYVMSCPVGGSGRAVVHGRMYTLQGKLVAAMTQEGVVRTDIRNPAEETEPKAKL